jgi:prepilin-type N-terminal cleavage/methylation domain-containing protein
MKVRNTQRGFTLIEIAIVLLIIGLLLGGVMKGQSMINSARVRSLANDLTGIEAAWISFQDRYRSIPGDYGKADTHIDTTAKSGNANAIVEDGEEVGAVWQHLSAAGFISGAYSGGSLSAESQADCTEATCPSNPFNGFYKISNSSNAMGSDVNSHELSTGGNIPVEVMYELDLKIDDGNPETGRFRALDDAGDCVTGTQWNVVGGVADCAGVLRLPL